MKFEIDDIVFHYWVGIATEVKIIKCFPKTDRYRIQQTSDFEFNVNASEIFRTEKEVWQSKIDTIDNKIGKLEETREEYKKNIIRIREAEE